MPMTEHELARLEALAQAARVKPWTALGLTVKNCNGWDVADVDIPEDAAYIVAACNALPALVAEVRRLTEERDAAEAKKRRNDPVREHAEKYQVENTRFRSLLLDAKDELQKLEAEVARLERERDAALAEVAKMAAGAWQDGPTPKDGSHILALFRGDPYVVYWDSWQTGETIPGEGTYIDGEESGWIIARNGYALIGDEPEKWAQIIHPNRHTPADQPTDWQAQYETYRADIAKLITQRDRARAIADGLVEVYKCPLQQKVKEAFNAYDAERESR